MHKKKLVAIIAFRVNVTLSEADTKSCPAKQRGTTGRESTPVSVQKSTYITEIFGNNKSSNGKADRNNKATVTK